VVLARPMQALSPSEAESFAKATVVEAPRNDGGWNGTRRPPRAC
jgi:hypothetical protein